MTGSSPSGGCQCGAIRYRIDLGFGDSGICHCRMCQRAVGNVFAPLVTAKGVEWRGTPARWASSSIAERGFCATCGTPLYLKDFDSPQDEFEIMIATLDDPDSAPPRHHVGIESRLSWIKMADCLPEHITGARTGDDLSELVSNQDPAALTAKEDQ